MMYFYPANNDARDNSVLSFKTGDTHSHSLHPTDIELESNTTKHNTTQPALLSQYTQCLVT